MGKLKVLSLGSELVKQTNWENIFRKRGDFDYVDIIASYSIIYTVARTEKSIYRLNKNK
jgi:hypothetical protein